MPGPTAAQANPFPASLLEHCQQIIGPTPTQQRMANDSQMRKFVIDADDLQLSAQESLHTLALMRAGVRCPSAEVAERGGFLNGMVAIQYAEAPAEVDCCSGQEASIDRLSLPLATQVPQSVQSEVTARLVAASRLHNAGGDMNSVLLAFVTTVWILGDQEGGGLRFYCSSSFRACWRSTVNFDNNQPCKACSHCLCYLLHGSVKRCMQCTYRPRWLCLMHRQQQGTEHETEEGTCMHMVPTPLLCTTHLWFSPHRHSGGRGLFRTSSVIRC
jgi:hypothetical protein